MVRFDCGYLIASRIGRRMSEECLQWRAHAPSWKAFSNVENTFSAGDFEI